MKTHTIKTAAAELLIVELPRVCDYELDADMLWVINLENGFTYRAEGSYTLLGKPDDIREDIARLYVQKTNTILGQKSERWFKNYKNEGHFLTATESLLSAIDSVIFWDVNPIPKPDYFTTENSHIHVSNWSDFMQEWHEAESRTFNRSRTLIFAKQ